jgi:hypothetical protein
MRDLDCHLNRHNKPAGIDEQEPCSMPRRGIYHHFHFRRGDVTLAPISPLALAVFNCLHNGRIGCS